MNTHNSKLVWVIATGLGLCGSTLRAQSGGGFDLSWSTFAGGGNGTGANFKLSGTVGQPAAVTGAGGKFVLRGGFWSGMPETVGPRLRIIRSGGSVLVIWPAPSTDFVLEAAPRVTGSAWTAVSTPPIVVGEDNLVALPASGASRFFRLRKE